MVGGGVDGHGTTIETRARLPSLTQAYTGVAKSPAGKNEKTRKNGTDLFSYYRVVLLDF